MFVMNLRQILGIQCRKLHFCTSKKGFKQQHQQLIVIRVNLWGKERLVFQIYLIRIVFIDIYI